MSLPTSKLFEALIGSKRREQRKLWRNQNGLEFPSFYLELVVARALVEGLSYLVTMSALFSNTCAIILFQHDSSPRQTPTTRAVGGPRDR